MVFAAQKLRMQPRLGNPTVLIVVDRIDLDAQISSTFHASDVPNLGKGRDARRPRAAAPTGRTQGHHHHDLQVQRGGRGAERARNIVALADEAHRTQEGDLGLRMRSALPNAFLFGFTGTPINRRDRNIFATFGAEEDERGYMSRYGFEESVRDAATLPLHFEPRLVQLHIDRAAIDEAFRELTGSLTDLDRDNLARTASRMAILVKAPERIQAICGDIARLFQDRVAPEGFKAMVVTYDQECCLLTRPSLIATSRRRRATS